MSEGPASSPAGSGATGGNATKAVPVPAPASASSTAAKAVVADEGNPALRMMGLPRIRARLPSRNWLIFLSITGSFASAVFYDRYQKKRTIRKWCDLVSPMADDTIAPDTLPRRVTIYLSAPPGDGLRSAREHFYEYVKPVLVAAAVDWDVVEGRREGDVRWGTAERIRINRRRRGEGSDPSWYDELNEKEKIRIGVEEQRERAGTKTHPGVGGDVVIGRNTWKEYVRGLHEGWLGPVDKPQEVSEEVLSVPAKETLPASSGSSSLGDAAVHAAADLTQSDTVGDSPAPADDASPTDIPLETPKEEEKPEEEKKKKLTKPDPYISTTAYSSASPPSSCPEVLGPATVIPLPHILGFLNTPIRIARFLNRRALADDVCRMTASGLLATYRPFDSSLQSQTFTDVEDGTAAASTQGVSGWEQQGLLQNEESEWHKSVRTREREEGKESVWLDRIVIDERIGQRMQKFEITAEDEREADRLFIKPREEADRIVKEE